MDHEKGLQLLLDAIHLNFDSADLKSRLNKCDVGYIKNWRDSYGFDIIHHCILENNILALLLFLDKGLFKPPHVPSTWPYLHLVACLGFKCFISTVIQEFRYQNNAVLLDWTAFSGQIDKKIQGHVPNLQEQDKTKPLTPIDVAALFSHLSCVRQLLDFWQLQTAKNRPARSYHQSRNTNPSSSLYLSVACKANSPLALRILLKDSDVEDRKEALECAMRMSSPECVDIVLRDNDHRNQQDSKKAFQGMNLFHVLYSYSSCCTDPQRYEAIIEITSILLRHGEDVNTLRPSRTFPLHSLLSHRGVGCSMEQRGPFLIAALLMLLKSGADPNVDEVLIEKRLGVAEHNTAFGRQPHPSAAHCLISSVPFLKANAFEASDGLVSDSVDNYCYKCLELLVRHGSNLGYLGSFKPFIDISFFPENTYYNGTVLHCLLNMRSVTLINYPVLRFILHYGVDADTCGDCLLPGTQLHITYAINLLIFSVWTLGSHESRNSDDKHEMTKKDIKHFLYVMRFMSQPALVKAYNEFLTCINQLRDLDTQLAPAQNLCEDKNPLLIEMMNAYKSETFEPWSLQRCCSQVVWSACRHHMGNVYSLSIPGGLRKVVMSFF